MIVDSTFKSAFMLGVLGAMCMILAPEKTMKFIDDNLLKELHAPKHTLQSS